MTMKMQLGKRVRTGVLMRLVRLVVPGSIARRSRAGDATLPEALAEELGHPPEWTVCLDDAMAPQAWPAFHTWHGTSGCL
jgi:hypothetical protein